jgi:hypothetical protein
VGADRDALQVSLELVALSWRRRLGVLRGNGVRESGARLVRLERLD